jgi:hypothetical protein
LVKKCVFCGRFFIPDYRIGERQKACFREVCKKARKQKAQREWVRKNPGYFQGRYPYVKEWREKRRKSSLRITEPGTIQDKIPLGEAWQRLILLIPGEKGERIQDKIVLRRQSRCTFAAYG